MTRFAAIPLALALIVPGIDRTDAQDQPAITPNVTPKATEVIPGEQREPPASQQPSDPRELAEAFVAAVLAGRTADAAALTTSKRAASEKWMEEFREAVRVGSLEIRSVHINSAENALAVSQRIKLEKPHPDVGDTVCAVLQLAVDGGRWVVRDLDLWSEVDAAKAFERFTPQPPDVGTDTAASPASTATTVSQLDQPTKREIGSAGPTTGPDYLPGSTGTTDLLRDGGIGNLSRADHQDAFRQHDERARQTAQAYQKRLSHLGPQDPDTQKLKADLHEAVAAAFEARQQRQRAELAKLQQRFTRIQQLIENRERIKDKIIDHRVEELLDPALRWNGSTQTGTDRPSPGTPSATGDVAESAPASLALVDKLHARWKLLEKTHKSGQTGFVDVLTAATQYYEAAAAAAESREERRNARQQQVNQLKELVEVTVTKALYGASEVGQADVLAAEAELLRVEAQLKQETDRLGDAGQNELQGVVVAISDGHVEITVGHDDGAQKGMQFQVFDDETYLGRIGIIRSDADKSIGRIEEEDLQAPIRRGDRVRQVPQRNMPR